MKRPVLNQLHLRIREPVLTRKLIELAEARMAGLEQKVDIRFRPMIPARTRAEQV